MSKALRGRKDSRRKVGKDQVEIDLDRFDPGLIALIGANGTGKTTLIENMHPYSQMLTRTGKLQDHFMLRDSIRDLYFVDEKTGTEYRAFMQIDGANVSGGVEYFLYRKENGQFVPLNSSINGRKDPYDSEIRNLFGNLDLYLRSTFYAQKQPKNHPELQDAAPTQRKEVFRNLGGLDYLQTYADYANAEQKSLNEKLIGENASINTLEQLVEDLPGQREVLNNRRCALKVKEEYLKEIECEKNRLENELKEISQRVEQNKRLHHELDTLYEQNQELSAEKAGLGKTIEQYQGALESRTEFAEKLQTIEDLKKQKADLENEKAEIYKQREQIQAKYSDRKNAVAAAEREITAKKAETDKKLYEADIERGTIKAQAEQLDKELREPVTENCPTCGQKWPPEKRTEFEQERAGKKLECEELQRKIFEIDKGISAYRKDLLKLKDELSKLEEPEAPFMPQFDDARLDAMLVELKNLNESFVRKKLDEAREAGVRIEESEKRLRLLEEQLSEKMKKANDLQDQVDDECEDKYEEVNEAVELARKNYAETDKEIARIQAEIDTTEKIIESLKEKDKELESLKESIKGHEKDLREWQYLQKACGPNGIQALELDAMGPSIAEVANSILESAYGSRFQIEFRTTRIGGSGSKTKQIEDFLIIVHDSLDGSEQPFEWMSGGESVWIKRAIYDAFGIIRARKTGTKFLTIFQDESDGALDPEARINYFKMLQKSHDESGRYHTIVISHSMECQEMVGQRILMDNLMESSREEVAV
jgi:exonuclease SbcC